MQQLQTIKMLWTKHEMKMKYDESILQKCLKTSKIYNDTISFDNEFILYMKADNCNVYTVFDQRFGSKILKHKWCYDHNTGFMKMIDKNIGLAEFIMQYCLLNNTKKKHGIYHINQQKTDNRSSNLIQRVKYVPCKQRPQKQLSDIDILHYPRYVQYEQSMQSFTIKKHPNMKTNETIYGTSRGTLLNQYFDIITKGKELDDMNIPQLTLERNNTFDQQNSYKIIREEFSTYMNPSETDSSESPELNFIKSTLKTPTFTSQWYHMKMLGFTKKILSNLTKKSDDIISFDPTMVLKKSDLPEYVLFNKKTKKRGCKFSYCKRNDDKIIEGKGLSSSKKSISLYDKYNEMLKSVKVG
jgi:hypothetical protein